jgi:predicted nucleotidyltransferase
MTRDDVIVTLRAHQAELQAAGIQHLGVFGSVARGQVGHDVDLLAALEESAHLSLVDLVGLEQRLAAWLGAPVDLVQEGTLKDRVRERVAQELVRVF